MSRAVSVVAVSTMALSACVSTPISYRAQPVERPETTVEYSRGVPISKSRGGDGSVAVGFSPHTDDGRIIMLVSVRNNSSRSENFGSENLDLVDSANRRLRVWAADDLIIETSAKASGQKTMLAVGAVLGAASAIASSYSTTTGSYSTPYGTGTFQSTTSDPSIALAGTAAATSSAVGGMSAIDRGRDDRIATIRRVYLQTNTVAPGQQYNGLVVADAPSGSYPQNLTLSVQWLGQVNKFSWTLTRLGSSQGAVQSSSVSSPPPAGNSAASLVNCKGASGELVKVTAAMCSAAGGTVVPDRRWKCITPNGASSQAWAPMSPEQCVGRGFTLEYEN